MAKKISHKDRAHSTLGASSASRWMNCPGSVALCEGLPNKTSFFAEEGTFAHELGEHCLKTMTNALDHSGERFGSEQFVVTDEMAKAVQEYIDFVRSLKSETKGEWLLEYKFNLHHLHPTFFGTNDALVYEDFGVMHVIDYKHGAGVAVEVEQNSQLLYYALGGLALGDFDKVFLHVVQPRAFHPDGGIRSWETTPKDVLAFGQLLRKKAFETENKDAPLNDGDWCRWCKALPTCPKVQSKALDVAKVDFSEGSSIVPTADSLSLEQVAKVVEHKKLLETFIKNCEEIIYSKLMEGEDIEGVKLVAKRKRKEFINEEKIIKKFESEVGEKLFETKLISVSKLSKLVGEKNLKGLFSVVDTGFTIAPSSDRRHAIAPKANKDFESIEDYEF